MRRISPSPRGYESRTELSVNTPNDLHALLSQPLADGYRPYAFTTKSKGLIRARLKETATLKSDLPAGVPIATGGLAVGKVLERATYGPTREWGFRGDGLTTFSHIPNIGRWAINHRDIGSISHEPAVVMDRVQTDEGVVATVSPGRLNGYNHTFFPRVTYTIAPQGVTLRDYGPLAVEGKPGMGGLVELDETRLPELAEFAENVQRLRDDNYYGPITEGIPLCTPTGINENQKFVSEFRPDHDENIEWRPVGL